MEESTYTLTTITPLYSHGFFTRLPEFRPTEIKALMRFCYRAVGRFSNQAVMFSEEGKLFGSAGNGNAENSTASPIRIKVVMGKHPIEKYPLVFRKPEQHETDDKKFKKNKMYIGEDSEFSIVLRMIRGNERAIVTYEKWFELSLALFGIGGRARRARGAFGFAGKHICFTDRESFLKSLMTLLNELSNNAFERDNDTVNLKTLRNGNYPYVKKIILGNSNMSWQNLLLTIDGASHQYKSNYTGSASPRYASPVYVSAVKIGNTMLPIITVLQDKGGFRDYELQRGQQFINAIIHPNTTARR